MNNTVYIPEIVFITSVYHVGCVFVLRNRLSTESLSSTKKRLASMTIESAIERKSISKVCE